MSADAFERWTDRRFERLYARYNTRYWGGRLPSTIIGDWDLRPGSILAVTCHDVDVINVDVAAHRNDREVRSSVLHEMAHVAVGRGHKPAHGSAFLHQIERLVRLGAPIHPDFDHFGVAPVMEAIPAEFKSLRAVLARRRPCATLDRLFAVRGVYAYFYKAGAHGMRLSVAAGHAFRRYALRDGDDRPLTSLNQVKHRAKLTYARGAASRIVR